MHHSKIHIWTKPPELSFVCQYFERSRHLRDPQQTCSHNFDPAHLIWHSSKPMESGSTVIQSNTPGASVAAPQARRAFGSAFEKEEDSIAEKELHPKPGTRQRSLVPTVSGPWTALTAPTCYTLLWPQVFQQEQTDDDHDRSRSGHRIKDFPWRRHRSQSCNSAPTTRALFTPNQQLSAGHIGTFSCPNSRWPDTLSQ